MADLSGSGYANADRDAPERWWTGAYALRLAVAMLLAGAVVGAILGPVGLLLSQLSVALSGGTLSFPGWMYSQASGLYATLGVLLGSTCSVAMVLLLPRPSTRRALLMRICAGPVTAGILLVILALFWGGRGIPIVLLETAFGCAVFLLAAAVSRTTIVPPEPVIDAAVRG